MCHLQEKTVSLNYLYSEKFLFLLDKVESVLVQDATLQYSIYAQRINYCEQGPIEEENSEHKYL